MPITVTVQRVNTTVELLLWRAYGRKGQTPAMLAAALALNRGLAGKGAILPLRTPVVLPDLPVPRSANAPVARPTVNLFGDV